MPHFRARIALGATFAALAAPVVTAGGPQSWPFDIQTAGENVSWTSPTNVNPARPMYEASYVITSLQVNVRFGIFNLGPIDVTDQVPPEQLSNSNRGLGPAPAVFLNDLIVYPDPPTPAAIQATVAVALNAAGFGTLNMTNVTLGPLTVDLGPPLGVQTVTLTRVRAIGTVTVDPIACPADLDGDGFVGSSDLATLLGGWNSVGPADLNLDGIVNAADLASMLGAWGPCPS